MNKTTKNNDKADRGVAITIMALSFSLLVGGFALASESPNTEDVQTSITDVSGGVEYNGENAGNVGISNNSGGAGVGSNK